MLTIRPDPIGLEPFDEHVILASCLGQTFLSWVPSSSGRVAEVPPAEPRHDQLLVHDAEAAERPAPR